jgi:hypothetical protein
MATPQIETRPALIQAADTHGDKVPCEVEAVSGKQLSVRVLDQYPPYTAVTVQCEDVMFLGDIICCVPQPAGGYRSDVKIHQVLTGLQNLMNLRARLLGEGAGHPVSATPELVPVRSSASLRQM